MLRFILGGAGSGKSSRLTRDIRADIDAGQRAFLIIPEQQANLSERTMLPKLPEKAGLTFTIAGFSRLAREVAARFGGGAGLSARRGLCSLIMWQNLREMKGLLKEYGAASPRSDVKLTSLLLSTLDDLRAGGITAAMLENTSRRLEEGDPLRAKLEDLALLYASYDNALLEALDAQSVDEIAALAQTLSRHDYFAGANVYLDSFTGFTAEEYDVLRHILRQAKMVTITLYDGLDRKDDPAFVSIRDTILRLHDVCEREGIEITYERLPDNHRATSQELLLLERHLWDLALSRPALIQAPERPAITPLRCTNIYAEAEATALHVLDLVQNGARFGDIAVVVRDTQTYRGVLDAAFERYQIPFYFSEKTALSDQPLARFLLSALRSVAHGWQSQDILMMVKTGLCPVSAQDADLFELYVSTWDINGSAFAAPVWTKNPDGYTDRMSKRAEAILAAANRVREAVMTPLLRLHARIKNAAALPELCAALYELMCEMQLSARCAELAKTEMSFGYLKQAGETLRIYDTVCSTLTQISTRLPTLRLDTQELITVLNMMFSQTEIASVPSLHDSVTIGAADTLRVENVAYSFVLGLNEGDFPAVITDQGLLCNAEKQQLQELGLRINGIKEVRASDELLYLWRAMTKPSRALFVSTLLVDVEGKEKPASLAFERLLYLFPYLKDTVRTFDLSMIAPISDATVPTPAQDPNDTAEATTDQESAEDELTSLYQPLAPSPFDLSPELMGNYFGTTLTLSQSRIESFVNCPYGFYCRYLLDLREREVARVAPSDSGTFIHYLLEHFILSCMQKDGSLCIPSASDAIPMADRIVNSYLQDVLRVAPSDFRLIHTFRRLRALALTMLQSVLEDLADSQFVPRHVELHIGNRPGDEVAAYEIPLEQGRRILLGGVVDRVDCYTHEGTTYVRVVDYKTGAKQFSVQDPLRGLQLQLLIYLFSLCRAKQAQPAGIMYISTATEEGESVFKRSGLLLNDPTVLGAMRATWPTGYFTGVKSDNKAPASGKPLIDADTFAALEQSINETLCRIGNDMLGGRAARTPSQDACAYCTMRTACPDRVV